MVPIFIRILHSMKNLKYFLILLFVTVSCVEHVITVRVHPDGHYTMQLTSSGDSTDVFDNDFPHPKPNEIWMKSVQSSVEENDTIWTMTTQGYLFGFTRFNEDSLSPAPLRYPVNLTKKEGWVSTRYIFSQIFSGRSAFSKYPILAEALRSNAKLDSIRWLPEALEYVCTQALHDIQKTQSIEIESALSERIQHHLQNYFIHVKEEKLFGELNRDHHAFLQNAMAPFLKKLPGEFIPTMSRAMEPYEAELKVTMGLQDDSFEYLVLMPGMMTHTNADTIMKDTLKWMFDLETFLNDDMTIEAESVIFSQTKLQKLIVLLVLSLLIFIGVMWKRSR